MTANYESLFAVFYIVLCLWAHVFLSKYYSLLSVSQHLEFQYSPFFVLPSFSLGVKFWNCYEVVGAD
jgi:hypothetical protein